MTTHDLLEACWLSIASGAVYAAGLFAILSGVLS